MKRYAVTLLYVKQEFYNSRLDVSRRILTEVVDGLSHTDAFGRFYHKTTEKEGKGFSLELHTVVEIPDLNAPGAQEVPK